VSELPRAAVVILSDRAARGERPDACIPVVEDVLEGVCTIVERRVLPDDPAALQAELIDLSDRGAVDVIFTSGGTGLSPRDRTPQATSAILDYEIPGIPEAMRSSSLATVKTAMLSRAVAGVRGRTLIVNLPGSPKGVRETLTVIVPVVRHAVDLLTEGAHDHHV